MPIDQRSSEEIYKSVHSAYITDIVPSIRNLYEITNQVRESFLLVHCAILSLSGFYSGTKDTSGKTYTRFVTDFFPEHYAPEVLWKSLRNGLVHGYTFTGNYILAFKHPEAHMAIARNVMSKKTGLRENLIVLNFENFLEDLETAAVFYFMAVEKSPDLLGKLCKRYEFAPPVEYVRDYEIPVSSELGFLRER